MIAELYDPNTSFDVPQHASHITGTGNNLSVVDETAAAEITRMSAQFPSPLHVATLFAVEVVDRTDIVKTTTSNETSRWRISTGHDPAGSQRNRVDLVGRVRIPNNQLSILRGRNKVALVRSPVHSVNLGEMAA